MNRDVLIEAILDFFVGQDLATLEHIRAVLAREIDGAGPDALFTLQTRLATELGWDYYPSDPLARRIHHALADRFLTEDCDVQGADHLENVANAPLTILANHLSYADANVIDVLLERSGYAAVADRLTALAGPKVFTSRVRRFSSLCFGTIRVPQSAEVSSEEAVLNVRDVARAARKAIDVAHARLAAGDALLLFAEGTRSRTAAMQPLLPAAARYLKTPGTWVLPVALTGPELLFPVTDATLRPARVTMRIGSALPAATLFARAEDDRRVAMDAIGLAIAELLPPSYRGCYAHDERFPEAATALRLTRVEQ